MAVINNLGDTDEKCIWEIDGLDSFAKYNGKHYNHKHDRLVFDEQYACSSGIHCGLHLFDAISDLISNYCDCSHNCYHEHTEIILWHYKYLEIKYSVLTKDGNVHYIEITPETNTNEYCATVSGLVNDENTALVG